MCHVFYILQTSSSRLAKANGEILSWRHALPIMVGDTGKKVLNWWLYRTLQLILLQLDMAHSSIWILVKPVSGRIAKQKQIFYFTYICNYLCAKYAQLPKRNEHFRKCNNANCGHIGNGNPEIQNPVCHVPNMREKHIQLTLACASRCRVQCCLYHSQTDREMHKLQPNRNDARLNAHRTVCFCSMLRIPASPTNAHFVKVYLSGRGRCGYIV